MKTLKNYNQFITESKSEDDIDMKEFYHEVKELLKQNLKTKIANIFYKLCKSGNLTLIKLMIKMGADYNESSQYGARPIQAATSAGKLNIIKYLMSLPKIDLEDKNLDISATWSKDLPTLKFIDEKFGMCEKSIKNICNSEWEEGILYVSSKYDISRDNLEEITKNGLTKVLEYLFIDRNKPIEIFTGKYRGKKPKKTDIKKWDDENDLQQDQNLRKCKYFLESYEFQDRFLSERPQRIKELEEKVGLDLKIKEKYKDLLKISDWG